MAWYTDPLFTSIAGATIGVVGTSLVSLYLHRKSNSRLRVDCFLDKPKSLLAISDRVEDKIEIQYEKKSVNSVYLFSMDIVNSGNRAIEKQPILVQLDEAASIIDYSITTEPQDGFGIILETQPHESRLELEVELLNPGDRVAIEIVSVQNSTDTIGVFLKNKNVKYRVIKRDRDYTMIAEGSFIEKLAMSIAAAMAQSVIGHPMTVTYKKGGSKRN
tara:strand:- start:107060 stop:107710 length:651 start_codon:yes stop_codon:yes gene_type:complete